ncbi:acireductone dioxygenase 1-like [Lotus japonicus]|uniref:acireductone dioxygenase 1-like n=1 Tax=Lotus japonicus TaxID=34305 RepID=UPI00258AC0C5|nr:acireductone dioxygenase 1-like [Lotus japonicus]
MAALRPLVLDVFSRGPADSPAMLCLPAPLPLAPLLQQIPPKMPPSMILHHDGSHHLRMWFCTTVNEQIKKEIQKDEGNNFEDMLDLCPEKVENYEKKLKNFYTEHIHHDEEIRYCLEGSGYFDVRDKGDRWIRIWIKAGDLIILPAGSYHRITLNTSNYVKLMRLFIGEPVWTAYNRPQEDNLARKEYMKGLKQRGSDEHEKNRESKGVSEISANSPR